MEEKNITIFLCEDYPLVAKIGTTAMYLIQVWILTMEFGTGQPDSSKSLGQYSYKFC